MNEKKRYNTDTRIQNYASSIVDKVSVKRETLTDSSMLTIAAGTIYELTYDSVIGISLGTPTASEKCEYCLKFDVGATIPTLTLPAEVVWAEEPELEANKHYVILISYENGRFYGDWKSYDLTN